MKTDMARARRRGGVRVIIRPMIGDYEIPSIETIRVLERRRVSDLPVIGLGGDLQQDLGAASLAVEITGTLQGDAARDGFLEAARAAQADAEPIDFVADILTATKVEQVLIRALEVEETNDWARAFRYRMELRDFVEPPPPPAPFADLGLDFDAELDLLADLGLDGLELPGLLTTVPTLGDPVAPVLPALDGVEAATGGLASLTGGLRDALLGTGGGTGGGGGG